ncbi:uncharacterized protein CCOS01_06018 [Colletotrichum costaricense]|uniref:Uncharacterized protein n=2 Tax=Colletotrichum acutatum species complex TaxID=2707335 RepID=A0AAI9Z1I7_9PEZI|nr:uncharacterized protein CCOS01_06018 [Colletotrichum costaricense]XP_060385959.1 uncharacterized protein CTAM01_03721 [Colletotrichum tamarilloi]KAI3542412.1 hypothetical protein CSPX01_06890 [Colletotrichum filicis]KAK1506386.1 hypothetical protein CTAM01_03721 [Colletotrichum tamarilloi]KAK1530915.1 hypothetical protein CCOS01_06018 [Colletotrichum costaricense]
MECQCQVSHTLAALGYGCYVASTMFLLPVPGPPLSRLE